MKLASVLCTCSLLWCIAALAKLAGCRARREPYRFSLWDGGLVLRGQRIGRTGMIALAGFALACAAASAYLLVAMVRL